MAEPTRLLILKALTEALERITPEAGYSASLAGAVFRGKEYFGNEEDPLPALIIEEAEENLAWPVQTPSSGAVITPLCLLLMGAADVDEVHPTDPAHRLMHDVQTALTAEKTRVGVPYGRPDVFGLGGVIHSLEIGSGLVSPPGTKYAPTGMFILPIRITYIDIPNAINRA